MMEILIAMLIAFSPVPEDYTSDSQITDWTSLGSCRVTEYCYECNSPVGNGSASGKPLEYGDCACAWLPMGTQVMIDGEIFTVTDVCGTDAIDIYIPSDGVCRCDRNEYVEVLVRGE